MYAITTDFRTDCYRVILTELLNTNIDVKSSGFPCDYELANITAIKVAGVCLQACYFRFAKFIDQFIRDLMAFYQSKRFKNIGKPFVLEEKNELYFKES